MRRQKNRTGSGSLGNRTLSCLEKREERRGQAFFCFRRTTAALSRMDEEESPLKLSDFAVSEAVEETAESFRDFARSQGHPLELAIVPGLTYCGDGYAVR